MLCKNFQATTNSTLICGLSFRARCTGRIAPFVSCADNGRILLANLLQSSRSTFSCASFPSFFAFKEGIWDTRTSALGGSPTVSPRIWHISLPLSVCYANALEMCTTRRATINVPANRLRDGLWHTKIRPWEWSRVFVQEVIVLWSSRVLLYRL